MMGKRRKSSSTHFTEKIKEEKKIIRISFSSLRITQTHTHSHIYTIYPNPEPVERAINDCSSNLYEKWKWKCILKF